jgi:hypothetical protein
MAGGTVTSSANVNVMRDRSLDIPHVKPEPAVQQVNVKRHAVRLQRWHTFISASKSLNREPHRCTLSVADAQHERCDNALHITSEGC